MRDKVIALAHLSSVAHAAAQIEAMVHLLDAPRMPRVIVIDDVPREPDPRPAYEQLGYTKRHMELNAAKAAKAEAKRQRRRERNLRTSQ